MLRELDVFLVRVADQRDADPEVASGLVHRNREKRLRLLHRQSRLARDEGAREAVRLRLPDVKADTLLVELRQRRIERREDAVLDAAQVLPRPAFQLAHLTPPLGLNSPPSP